MDIGHYNYSVTWAPDDNVYVATVTEFPSLAAHGDSQEEAFAELRIVVGDVVADLAQSGEPIPEPLSARRFSGRFNVRVPSSLHRELATDAAGEGVSLNQWVAAKLARGA